MLSSSLVEGHTRKKHGGNTSNGMARVRVLFFGPLYEIVGKRSEILDTRESSTVMDLLLEMNERYGEKFSKFVFSSSGKRISSSIAFAVDGASLPRSRLSKTKCANIHEFVILPPISGG